MPKMPELIVKELTVMHRSVKSGDVSPKVKKLLARYHISYGERIIAHLLKTAPLDLLIFDGLVFTEKALYINPKHCKIKVSNRIAYDKLCQYVILHTSDREPIFLLESLNNRQQILDKTILGTNAGNDLTEFLLKLQQHLMEDDPSASEVRDKTVWGIFTDCKPLMKQFGLSMEICSILDGLIKREERYCAAALTLAAEDMARKKPAVDYRNYIASLPSHIPPGLRSSMLERYDRFIKSFISDLEDFSCDISNKYLNEVYNNWQNDPGTLETSLFLRGLICARTLHFGDMDAVVNTMEDLNITPELVQRLRLYRGKCANWIMREVGSVTIKLTSRKICQRKRD